MECTVQFGHGSTPNRHALLLFLYSNIHTLVDVLPSDKPKCNNNLSATQNISALRLNE